MRRCPAAVMDSPPFHRGFPSPRCRCPSFQPTFASPRFNRNAVALLMSPSGSPQPHRHIAALSYVMVSPMIPPARKEVGYALSEDEYCRSSYRWPIFFDKTDGVTPETSLTVTNCKLTLMVDDANVPTLVLDTNPTASGGNNDMVHVTGDDAGFYDLELTAANLNYLGRAMLALTDAANHCPVFHEFMILPAVVYDAMVLGTDLFDVSVTQWLGQAVAAVTVNGVPEVDVTHIGGSAVTSTSGIPEVKVASIANDALTAAAIATDAIDADAIKADAVTEIQSGLSTLNAAGVRSAVGLATANLDTQLDALPTANENADALLDRANGVETGYTLRQALRLVLSALAGKVSGAGTTNVVIRDVTDSKNRISAVVDADGNRTSVTKDVS